MLINKKTSARPKRIAWLAGLLAWIIVSATAHAQSQSREEAMAGLEPYDGPSVSSVDPNRLQGKMMCGYQGWFTAILQGILSTDRGETDRKCF